MSSTFLSALPAVHATPGGTLRSICSVQNTLEIFNQLACERVLHYAHFYLHLPEDLSTSNFVAVHLKFVRTRSFACHQDQGSGCPALVSELADYAPILFVI